MQLVLDTNGLIVKKRNNAFFVMGGKHKRMISPHRIDSIAVTADCLLSSAAIRLAAKHEIPIFFFNAAAQVEARLWSPGFVNLPKIRRQQVLFALEPAATDWVRQLFNLKLTHQIENLTVLKKQGPSLGKLLSKSIQEMEAKREDFDAYKEQLIKVCRNQLMGIEGTLARTYWQTLSKVLPEELKFVKRTRRPAEDRFNASLNYLYGMLYSVVGSAVLAGGLDPQLGFLHTDAYNKPTLSFDMIEPFRPWVDQLLIEEAMKHRIKPAYFLEKDMGVSLAKPGKRWLIPLFNDFMEERIRFNGRRLSRKNHIYRYAGEFGQFLLKKEP